MQATSPISLDLFDFVDDFAKAVSEGRIGSAGFVPVGAPIIVFAENFFAQFFGDFLGSPITSFNSGSKRRAGRLAEILKASTNSDTTNVRSLITLFESFCDMYADVIRGSYGAGRITYKRFHEYYMSRLLERAHRWALEGSWTALSERIGRALDTYNKAIGSVKW